MICLGHNKENLCNWAGTFCFVSIDNQDFQRAWFSNYLFMNNDRPFSPEEFKAIFSKVPRLCVELVIKTPEGIILALRSLPTWSGQWHLPGGTVFYKEKIAHAIERIAKDELGISVNIQRLLGYIEYPSEEKERGFGSTVGMIFLCSHNKVTDIKPNNDEASEIKIFKELPPNIVEEHHKFLKSIWKEI